MPDLLQNLLERADEVENPHFGWSRRARLVTVWANSKSMAWGRGVVRRSKPIARARRYNEAQGFSSFGRAGFMQVRQ